MNTPKLCRRHLALVLIAALPLAACAAGSQPSADEPAESLEDDANNGGRAGVGADESPRGGSGGGGSGAAGFGGQQSVADAGARDTLAPMGDAGGPSTPDAAAAAYDPCPQSGSDCKIMPLGDSNTMIPGYRVALFRKALAAKKAMTYVGGLTDQSPNTVDGVPFPRGHEGHNGNNIDGLRGLVGEQLKAYQPHIVLLMIGTNDTHRAPNLDTAPGRLGQLIDAIVAASPDALVVVAKIVPSKDDPAAQYYRAGHNDRIRAFNDAIGPVIEQRRASGKHVVAVDMFAAFMAAPNFKDLMGDNLHPNNRGFAVMADVWWAAIAPALKDKR